MRKILYIHVGYHKTGSTFLQNIFSKNFNLLHDINAEEEELIKFFISTSLNIKNLVRKIEEKYNHKSINIISAERLSGHPIHYWADHYNIIRNIVLLGEYFEIRILVVERLSTRWIDSVYRQLIRSGFRSNYREYTGNEWSKPFYSKSILEIQRNMTYNYQNIFENTTVLDFEILKQPDELEKKLSKVFQVRNILITPKIINPSFKLNWINNKMFLIINRLSKSRHHQDGLISRNLGDKLRHLIYKLWIIK